MYHVLQLLFSLSKIVFYPFCFHGKTNFLSLSFCIPVRVLFLYSVFNEHSCGSFRLRGVRLDLSSRTVARQVLSALCSLTSVFGMGTGGPCTLKRRTILFLRSFTHLRLRFPPLPFSVCLVGSSGLEPPTSRLSGARSNHLSYEPLSVLFFQDRGFLFMKKAFASFMLFTSFKYAAIHRLYFAEVWLSCLPA